MSAAHTRDTPQVDGPSALLGESQEIDSQGGEGDEDTPDKPGAHQDGDLTIVETRSEDDLQGQQPRVLRMPKWLEGVPILSHYNSRRFVIRNRPKWMLDEVIREAGIGLIFGAPQTGKTVLAANVAISIALGVPCGERNTCQGNTVYFVSEGAGGFGDRILAAEAHRGISLGERVVFSEETVNLMKDEDVLKVMKLVVLKDCKLVVIDTLASSLAGDGDENSNRDMSKYLHGAKRIAQETGAAVLIIHHTGRDPNATMERGASALRGNVDTSIRVSRSDKHYKWEVVKSRDGPLGVSGAFDIEPYEFIHHDTGEVVQSIVVKHLEVDGEGAGASNIQSAKLHGNQAAVLAQLKIQFAGLPEVGACMPFEDAVRLCRDAVTVNDSKHRSTRTREVLRSLVRAEHIQEREDGQLCLPAA